jgi:hypothetical protein
MPFTLAHPLAIVPVVALDRRRWLPVSALAIGTMIPDLPLFCGIASDYSVTHSIPGLVTACLPLGLVAFGLYHGLLKRPLLSLLPDPIRRRAAPLARPLPTPLLATVAWAGLAIVLGAATHVFWDSFTHAGRLGYRLLPWLHDPALFVAGRPLRWYSLFQLGSTVVGMASLALLALAWLARQTVVPEVDTPPGLPAGGLVLAYGAIIGLPAAVLAAMLARFGPGMHAAYLAIVWSGWLLMVSALGYAAAWRLVPRRLESE